MSIRTPVSLNWLVKKHRSIAGQIAVTEKELQMEQKRFLKMKAAHEAELNLHHRHLEMLKQDLESIDRTLRMHEIRIDPSRLQATIFQSSPSTSKYGQLTRLIYKALATSKTGVMTTSKITAFVMNGLGLEPTPEQTKETHHRVRHRLEGLYETKRVMRLHPRQTSKEGSWRLPQLEVKALRRSAVALEVPTEEA